MPKFRTEPACKALYDKSEEEMNENWVKSV